MFSPPELIERARANVQKYPWAREVQKRIVEAAQPWTRLSDDETWSLMFGNTIKRSWMVWSDGYCPACKKGVPMYTWEMDAMNLPWKTRCPHCAEIFPKNDFRKFYQSGLDEHGLFDPARADRALLFNAEHPNPDDPLHKFGVDDGEGYIQSRKRWRFIGAYLIYGQWKQAIVRGLRKLSAAYAVTGDRAYAHKALILLDRVADLYPTFDFRREGVLYEGPGAAGYVSTWHDACEETRELVLAYDRVRSALDGDDELLRFLAEKAKRYGLANLKTSPDDVRRNIEDRILRDAIKNRHKIRSNYPRTEVALAIIHTVLGWPQNREQVMGITDSMLRRVTAVDGVTGEKGLAGYSAYVIQGLARFLARFAKVEPTFLAELLKRHPRLHQTYRFHIDTWCLHKYYPLSGDTGWFARDYDRYQGVSWPKHVGVDPSMHTFLWQLYKLTNDVGFVQVLYLENGRRLDGLPHDLFAENPKGLQEEAAAVIEREGSAPAVGSVNKQQWHLAILRSGQGQDARAAWLDYDAGGGHGHADGMNLGLFAKGLDLMPDFGYPPVHYGGWGSPRASWYKISASHNTVVVDGRSQSSTSGRTKLWADGEELRAIRASGAGLVGGKQYERTVGMIELSERDFYVIDIFRVVGGSDHAKFVHSHFGKVTPHGLSLEPGGGFGHGAQMRNFQIDPSPAPGWSVDWAVEDRYGLLPSESDVHLRYTDLTTDAQACLCEAWVSIGGYNKNEEAWVPRVMVRRRAKEPPLASTFVALIEPYEDKSRIAAIRRLPLQTPQGTALPDSDVAVEIQLADGRRDLFVAADVEKPVITKPPALPEAGNADDLTAAADDADDALEIGPPAEEEKGIVQKDWKLRFDGELCLIRRDKDGRITRVVVCRPKSLTIGDLVIKLKETTAFIELTLDRETVTVVSGKREDIQEITSKGRSIR